MKQFLIASTAALALAACAETSADYVETEYDDTDDAVVLTSSDITPDYDVTSRTTPTQFMLTSLLNADIMGSDGDEFTDVEDVFIRDGRITGISFDADAAFGGKRYAEFASLKIFDDGEGELDVMIPRAEDSFDDFDLIDENVQLTYGDAGEGLIGRDVTAVGYDDDVEIQDIIFSSNGRLQAYMIDPGPMSDPVKLMPSDVMMRSSLTTEQSRTEVLGEVDYDDDYDNAYDYRPDRK